MHAKVLTEIPQDEVCLNVIRTGVGPVTQSDVGAAATAEAPIFAFNVKVIGPEVKVTCVAWFVACFRLMVRLLPRDRFES